MKLNKGQVAHVGKQKLTGDIPDEIADKLKIPKDSGDIERLKARNPKAKEIEAQIEKNKKLSEKKDK